jgi:hypothetical protein
MSLDWQIERNGRTQFGLRTQEGNDELAPCCGASENLRASSEKRDCF